MFKIFAGPSFSLILFSNTFSCSDKTSPAKVISYVQCPNVSDYFLYGELHVMRCLVGEPVNNTNECQLTALKCSESLYIRLLLQFMLTQR